MRCFERLGRYDAAVATRAEGDPATAQRFAQAFASNGEQGYRTERVAELGALVASLTARLTDGPPLIGAEILNPPQLRLAVACAELGAWDDAMKWVEHACTRRSGQRPWFTSHPDLAPLWR